MEHLARTGVIKRNSKVISLGSGTGIIESFIAKHLCPKGQVFGVDFSHGLNKKAVEIAKKAGVKNVSFATGDVRELPVRAGTQDAVILFSPYLDVFEKTYEMSNHTLKKMEY
jgi:ubiquinone/menaquinone biosynthesis C-methylase UbiE